jgi:membrane protein DedA with SNARE-associated domain
MFGALFWTFSVVLLGYWLGSLVDPKVMERWILLAILGATSITLGPTLYHLLREERLRAFVSHQFSRVVSRLRRQRP